MTVKGKKINLSSLYSLLLAFVIGAVIIFASGNSPVEIYQILFEGAIGSQKGILQTVLQATPLIFCGLAVNFGMKGGLLNLGVEGQLYMGALCATVAGIYLNGVPAFIHIPICILASMVGGMIWAFLPIWLKIKRGAHEVVTALMMNYIATLLLDYLLNYPLREPDSAIAQSPIIAESAQLTRLFPRSKVTIAFFLGMALAVLLTFLLKKTVLGYQVTLVGANPRAAAASGVQVNKILIVTMLISGLCAGLAGGMEVMGSYYRLIKDFSPGYGFEGIAVAVLGGSPIGIVFSGLLFGGLRAGGMALNYGSNLSVKFISVLQGIIIVFVAAPAFLPHIWAKLFPRKKKDQEG